MCTTDLSNFIGHLINVTFKEGDVPISKKGKLVSVQDDFIELRTFTNTFLIRRSAIIALKIFEEGQQ